MIPKVSAALSRILRPIRFKPKGAPGSFSTQSGVDTTEHESAREAPTPLPKKEETQPPPALVADHAVTQVTSKSHEGHTQEADPKEIGLTRVIMDLRGQAVTADNGDIASQYETSSREQKSGSKLPKGSMVDRKAG